MRLIFISLFFIFSGTFAQTLSAQETKANNSNLKIVRGKVDTVYKQKHTIIGVCPANNTVNINGQAIKVYKTGSFGSYINLNEGWNKINIESIGAIGREQEELNIYYTKEAKSLINNTISNAIRDTCALGKSLGGAYFNYGTGDDRLGGSKINYITKDILLAINGVNSTHFRVKLSGSRYAFIPKEYIEFIDNMNLSTETVSSQEMASKIFAPAIEPILSSSWSIIPAEKADLVRIGLENKRPFIVYQENYPNRIVIELFGVHCNSNWITQYPGLKMIKDIEFRQKESDVLTIYINLQREDAWGYNIDYIGNSLQIKIKHRPNEKLGLKGMTIGIDAGHGGSSLGAVSAAGYREKDQNLAMAYFLSDILKTKGAKTVLTRDKDIDMSMADRKKVLSDNNIDLLISVHCNAGGDPLSTGGTSTYYKHWPSKNLAESVLNYLLEIDGVKCFGLVGNFNFSMLAANEYPSILVETLFMSNLWDEEHIIDPKFQKLMMGKLVKGLEKYLKTASKNPNYNNKN